MHARRLLLIFALILCVACSKTVTEDELMLVPKPLNVMVGSGNVKMPCEIVVSLDTALNAEGYRLTVGKSGISIVGGSDAGVFYGRQTLAQLERQFGGKIPCVEIFDEPRFEYRGMHLDVSRHFFSAEFVKKQLRAMASLKMNHLHWHLTDGVAWRLPIDSHPAMVAEQHYTKDEIREIVRYADSLHITVVPEIEMFGHSEEVCAAYPQLACDRSLSLSKTDRSLSLSKGPSTGSGTVLSHQLCIGNEQTFEFLEDVLSEVVELFPSKYIHVGGDEANYRVWEECKVCGTKMKKEGLSSPQELQAYGFKRISDFLKAKGREMIGWDEILDGGVPEGARVMSWRGMTGGEKAAGAGYETIMTPQGHCYLDAYQDAPYKEPIAFGTIVPLNKVYNFDPAPDSMTNNEKVVGVQTNLWTEKIEAESHAEYMLYPRVFAIAEVGWTAQNLREFGNFRKRALKFCDYFRADGYTTFDLATEVGQRSAADKSVAHKAVGKPVTYNTQYYHVYSGNGETTLTDGQLGEWRFNDGWQGFLNRDVDVTIDLGEVTEITSVGGDFCQWRTAEICMPVEVIVEVSNDGETFTELGRVITGVDLTDEHPMYDTYTIISKANARFVRLIGRINEHRWGWLFIDEIIVR